MNKAFVMELFLTGLLNGSYSTRQRHTRHANAIQDAICRPLASRQFVDVAAEVPRVVFK